MKQKSKHQHNKHKNTKSNNHKLPKITVKIKQYNIYNAKHKLVTTLLINNHQPKQPNNSTNPANHKAIKSSTNSHPTPTHTSPTITTQQTIPQNQTQPKQPQSN